MPQDNSRQISGYYTADQIQSLERAAMERVFERIRAKRRVLSPHDNIEGQEAHYILDFDYDAIESELLGKGDEG